MIVSYRNVRMELSSHDAGGLTDRDFTLAAQINDIPTDR
jgi:4a-hydroxytetrahydrobiopterin dehydratase